MRCCVASIWCDDEQGRACTLASARDLARIDARISSAEVSGKQNLDDLRRERVALASVIEGLEADGRRIREQGLRSRWRLQKVGEFVVKKL
jgi:hypothetical protein